MDKLIRCGWVGGLLLVLSVAGCKSCGCGSHSHAPAGNTLATTTTAAATPAPTLNSPTPPIVTTSGTAPQQH
jgi:hypothetical protein